MDAYQNKSHIHIDLHHFYLIIICQKISRKSNIGRISTEDSFSTDNYMPQALPSARHSILNILINNKLMKTLPRKQSYLRFGKTIQGVFVIWYLKKLCLITTSCNYIHLHFRVKLFLFLLELAKTVESVRSLE